MSNRKINDELLGKVLAAHDSPMQELNFINTVFAFLNRKTKYLQQSNAQTQINAIVTKHIEKAKQNKKKSKKSKNQSKAKKSATNVKDDQKDGSVKEKISENVSTSTSTNTSNDTSETSEATQTTAIETQTTQTTQATQATQATSTEIGVGTDPIATETNNEAKETPTNDDSEEDSGEKLVGNGGTTDKYVWTQTLDEIEMKIDIPMEKTGKDLIVSFEDKHLKIKLKGENSHIINGELHDRVDSDECSWMLDKEYGKTSKTLTIILNKHKGMNWWNKVIVGDPEIDTTKIVPANSKLDDLEPDVRSTVEKMMYDQRAKQMGKPTSKELEQQKILEKFKASHPEMDFSNVKFG